jgi:hypothetical protein
MIIDENNICKTELIRTDENYKNFIPFPQQVSKNLFIQHLKIMNKVLNNTIYKKSHLYIILWMLAKNYQVLLQE